MRLSATCRAGTIGGELTFLLRPGLIVGEKPGSQELGTLLAHASTSHKPAVLILDVPEAGVFDPGDDASRHLAVDQNCEGAGLTVRCEAVGLHCDLPQAACRLSAKSSGTSPY
ncbi:protein of unknown function [Methylorubrum extorquens]|uniref:Uncharacterized protein n=1 Tax=Methylorubrum extorquens TaxID=408 RepID=A0A2N9AZH9_METEX|nr:protein of unknown function [Methylorubrum extorquens]